MFLLVVCFLFGNNPKHEFTVDRIIYQEYNNGKNHYNQLILYRYSPDFRRYDVTDWVMLDKDKTINDISEKIGKYYYFNVVKNEKHYRVRTKLFFTIGGDVDLELKQKKLLPEKLRIRILK